MIGLMFVIHFLLWMADASSVTEQLCKIKPSSSLCHSSAMQRSSNTASNTTWIHLRDLPKDDQNFLRLARQTGDDPSCKTLKTEYDQVCFTPPPPQAFDETKAFCDAFVETCSQTLKTNLFTHLSELKIDYSEYCKQLKERFQYVCPKPLRFKTYAEQAVDFCLRYTERCPKAKIPDEPVPFRTEDETHIYTREIESRCKTLYRSARTFCLHPELLKYPKYAIPCALYKADCIDVYRRVIYG
ncbi:hypothetical protein Y032_0035g2998 [Ancylostoma ceylanicum]|uniref:DUF19 domain-containing protein n=1 Tax=Ancylostoma ceylanicum TaxID=53326 RepID=A0A016ULQ8_9BILA|nr:hypothetical protein Y032_0035g2998 [Ancylostoma ceylanicum]